MRGNTSIFASANQSPDNSSSGDDVSAPTGENMQNNLQQNTKGAKQPGSLVVVLILFGLYIIYWYMYNKKWKEAISKSAIFTFTHFMVSVGIAALIFFNLGNVFLTKVAALKIPVLSATCGALLTLWSI